ncbi:NAD-dependent epimerase/dehydratase family protein [Arthrobacter sp. TWP1-1]|uniref:NAD-dependent epimerase/dehydratase family protein n=1 Tax=Arthrobacter sp. TWP1-1 TaxID=2804568 RepID=UPI003CE846ED
MKRRLLLTGGLGTVGQLLQAELRRDYHLRITDRTAPPSGSPSGSVFAEDELLVGDLLDPAFARACVRRSDVVIHLAANASPTASATEARGNVVMAENVFKAAAEYKVERLVIASSVHANGLEYRDGSQGISPLNTSRPCCPYGAGKVAIEALAREHHEAVGGAVSCLRLGLTGWPLTEQQYAQTWLSAADLLRLVQAALDRPPGFGIYNAVSLDSATRWDTSNALSDLGWQPQDRWQVDVDRLPPAAACPCQMFSVP